MGEWIVDAVVGDELHLRNQETNETMVLDLHDFSYDELNLYEGQELDIQFDLDGEIIEINPIEMDMI